MTTREQIMAAAKHADSGFSGGPDDDGTMGEAIIGMAAIERFFAIAAEAGRRLEREEVAVFAKVYLTNNGGLTYGLENAIRARSTK